MISILGIQPQAVPRVFSKYLTLIIIGINLILSGFIHTILETESLNKEENVTIAITSPAAKL